jgi:uncharacterized membrane protein YhhN
VVFWSAATGLAVVALLFFERFGSRAGVWLAKPLASTAFLVVALSADALATPYGRAILAGLALSWLGDVLLIPRHAPKVFLAGVGSFLLGHVAYAIAFVARGIEPGAALVAAVIVGALAALVLRWLAPHVGPDMKVAVRAYVLVISLMVIAAVGTYTRLGNAWIPVGAIGFYLSDLSVARDRFVAEEFVNRIWGLPLYYAAQVILAWSVLAEGALAG